jgi:hypothetical protein
MRILWEILMKSKLMMPCAPLTRKLFRAFMALLGLCIVTQSCAYRFTNNYISRPNGMRTIAFESIYDTGKSPLPHEVLWEAVQREFARTNYLTVTSRERADGIVRIHILDSSYGPTGETTINEPKTDPETFKGGLPPRPRDFKQLTLPREYASHEFVNFTVRIELYNLKTAELVFTKDYADSARFEEFFAPMDDSFLHRQERLRLSVQNMSNRIAKLAVRDIFIR